MVAARHRIVEGAVGMVDLALDRLSADAVVELNEERKASMVGTCWSYPAATATCSPW